MYPIDGETTKLELDFSASISPSSTYIQTDEINDDGVEDDEDDEDESREDYEDEEEEQEDEEEEEVEENDDEDDDDEDDEEEEDNDDDETHEDESYEDFHHQHAQQAHNNNNFDIENDINILHNDCSSIDICLNNNIISNDISAIATTPIYTTTTPIYTTTTPLYTTTTPRAINDDDVVDGERMLEVTRKLFRSTERDPDRDLRKQVLLKTAIKKLPQFMDYNRYSDSLEQNFHNIHSSPQACYEHHDSQQKFYHSVQPNAIQMSTTSLRMLDINDHDQEFIGHTNGTSLESSLNASSDFYQTSHDSGVALFSPRSNKRSSSWIGLDAEMEIDNLTELSSRNSNAGSNNHYKKLRKREIID